MKCSVTQDMELKGSGTVMQAMLNACSLAFERFMAALRLPTTVTAFQDAECTLRKVIGLTIIDDHSLAPVTSMAGCGADACFIKRCS